MNPNEILYGEPILCHFLIYLELAKLLLENGADPNAQCKKKNTPLHIAVKREKIDAVEELLRYKANPNAKNEDGDTPLDIAIKKKNTYIVRRLLWYGADPNIKDNRGSTLLAKLCAGDIEEDDVTVIKLLLEFGATYTEEEIKNCRPAKAFLKEVKSYEPEQYWEENKEEIEGLIAQLISVSRR